MNAQTARVRLIFSMILFGTIGIFVRGIALPSGVIAMVRGYLGMLFLLAVTHLRGGRVSTRGIRNNLAALIVSGALLGFNWIALFESYRYTTVATATLCYYIEPILVVLTSPLFLRERMTWWKGFYAALAFVGMLFVSGVAEYGLPKASEARGVLFALAAAVMYAAVMILNKRMREIPAYDRTAVQLGVAGVVLTPYVLLTAQVDFSAISFGTILLLLLVGVVHTGVTYLLYFGAMDHLSGQSVSMLGYIDPVVAVLCSVLVLREPFSVCSLIGAVLVLAAALLNERTPVLKHNLHRRPDRAGARHRSAHRRHHGRAGGTGLREPEGDPRGRQQQLREGGQGDLLHHRHEQVRRVQ